MSRKKGRSRAVRPQPPIKLGTLNAARSPSSRPIPGTLTSDSLALLGQIRDERARLADLERAAVAQARSQGATWQEIADVMRLRRQTVMARYRAT
jgi:DNA-directed RNA polymerase specialized sigma24 family protein